MSSVLARLDDIERRFGSVLALDGAALELRSGEVHGVLGANGAGKSTLLNVLGGMIRPDRGNVEIDGRAVALRGPRDAWRQGIGLVHQHFTLVPALSVAENLALGMRGSTARHLRRDAEALMERTGLGVSLDARVEHLGVGDRQRTEILKALSRDPRILVLDEPTAVLTPREIEGLFSLLRGLADEGRAVALVAHKLDEVLGVADRITVLREGRTVLTAPRSETTAARIVRAMVGGDVTDLSAVGALEQTAPPVPTTGREVAALENVHVERDGTAHLRGVDLVVGAGEIVGIAGVEGNGQRELSLVLSGRLAPTSGRVHLPTGVGFIPQDRSTEGLIPAFDLAENLALALHRRDAYRSGAGLRWPALVAAAERVRTTYQVAAPSVRTRGRALSGGNQQRVVVGREVEMATDLLVAENPTRGLDIEAVTFVHEELRRLAEAGVGVVLVSTDLDEVLALSHRIHAMARGRLTAVPETSRTREGVGALMLSVAADE